MGVAACFPQPLLQPRAGHMLLAVPAQASFEQFRKLCTGHYREEEVVSPPPAL